ncbi:MAG TPA: hypothetical protein VLQ65_15115 [Saliniramus sp.]|nr:hypothetical protein [Saliniramus sp.]
MSKSYARVAANDDIPRTGLVVSMADHARGSAGAYSRSEAERDERRGVLLLFTGVRYERQIEPPEPVADDGRTRRRRRR